jgi:hypothetical protein
VTFIADSLDDMSLTGTACWSDVAFRDEGSSIPSARIGGNRNVTSRSLRPGYICGAAATDGRTTLLAPKAEQDHRARLCERW